MFFKSLAFIFLLTVICSSSTSAESKDVVRELYEELIKSPIFTSFHLHDSLEILLNIHETYEKISTKLAKNSQISQSSLSDLSTEFISTTGIELIKSLQIFYTNSLEYTDKIIEITSNLRQKQKEDNIVTGEAFLQIYNGIKAMKLGKNEGLLVILNDFLVSMMRINESLLHLLTKKARDHEDLMKLLELHEDVTWEIKNFCNKLTKEKKLSKKFTDLLQEVLEPLITLRVLGHLFSFNS